MISNLQKVILLVIAHLLLLGCAASYDTRKDFSDRDRELINAYFENHAAPPTPGPGTYRTQAAEKKTVNPENDVMNKKLARGAGYPLPGSLEQQLSPLARGYGRALIGWNVVIYDLQSRKVIDRVHARGY